MGSSLVLTGGAATAKTLKESISLTSHGFSVGDVLRWNNGSPSYVRAQADSAANAEVLGIVSANTDVNTFELTYAGYVDLPQFAGISYPVLFLSGVCAGGLTHNPPSAVGTVIKPVVTRHPTLNGYVMNNYLGTQIGGSSTIAVDEIQPVGTIMPFAGNAIPDTWLPCDSSDYSISSYPELYSKLTFSTGDKVPMYGYTAVLTVSGNLAAAGVIVGDTLHFKRNTNSWTASGSNGEEILYRSNTEIVALVTDVNTTNGTITVTVIPNYVKDDTQSAKYFTYPNVMFTSGTFTNSTSGSNYRILYGSGTLSYRQLAALTVTSVSMTHFKTPDLRGRMPMGIKTSSIYGSEIDGDPSWFMSIGNFYPMGSLGGEERHTLTAGEMPSHRHDYSAVNLSNPNDARLNASEYNKLVRRTNAGDALTASAADPNDSGSQTDVITNAQLLIGNTGGDAPHNNMPPYLAVRYIIKAKPYTRAAIIDGVDLPYSNLLVRSTDSNSLRSELLSGVSGGDLVFYTNSGEASKTGTERMRIEVGGEVGIGTNAPSQKLHVYDGALRVDLLSGTNSAILAGPGSNLQIKHTSGNSNLTMYNSSGGGFIFSTLQSGTEGERIRITGDGSLGIGTTSPGASLDVNGTIKTNTSITIGSATLAAPSGTAPLFGARAWVSFDGADLSAPGGNVKIWGKSSNIDYVGRPANGNYSVWLKSGQELPDANGAAFATSWSGNDLGGANQFANAKVQATNKIDVTVVDNANLLVNANYVTMVVFA